MNYSVLVAFLALALLLWGGRKVFRLEKVDGLPKSFLSWRKDDKNNMENNEQT